MGDDADELALEELVAVEEDVVAEPATGGRDQTRAEVTEGQLERLHIVAGNLGLLLGGLQLLSGRLHLEGTEVDQPQSAHSRNGKRDSVCPLRGHLGVRWVSGAVVEDEKTDDQNDLVGELTPALHQERGGDLATTVQTIFLGGDFAGTHGVFHPRRCCHGVFTANTNAVEEQRPDVANDPAVERSSPRADQHDQTDKHDDGILN